MQLFQHKDFYLASLLLYKHFELISYKREHGTTVFIFEDSEDLQKCVNDFYSMRAEVKDFLTMSGIIRNLKTIIHMNRAADQQVSTIQHEDLYHGFNNKSGDKL